MSKREVKFLRNLLNTQLSSDGFKSMDSSVNEKVMVSQKMLATGSFQSSINNWSLICIFSRLVLDKEWYPSDYLPI